MPGAAVRSAGAVPLPPAARRTDAGERTDHQDLEAAFHLFNHLSVRLEEAYGDLQGKVASLDEELREARQEREIQRAEKERVLERMAGLMAELPVGVVLLGAQGRVEEANPAALRMLEGLKVGAHWQAVIRHNLVGTHASGEVVLERRRRITLTRRELGGGACVIVLTEVTRIHELQERLARNQRLSEMGEMAARLAHQIRTPVASAMLFASGLSTAADEATRRGAQRILERLRHLESLVNDMLMFAKGSVGELERISARDLICRAVGALDPRFQASLSVTAEDADAEAAVVVNPDMVVGALVNLISNAIEWGAGNVEVGACVAGDRLQLTVTDDGPGIAEDIAGRIFEPFFTTRSGGTGLGLAVVRSVAEAFGGTVGCERACAGGARFSLSLPLESGSAADMLEVMP